MWRLYQLILAEPALILGEPEPKVVSLHDIAVHEQRGAWADQDIFLRRLEWCGLDDRGDSGRGGNDKWVRLGRWLGVAPDREGEAEHTDPRNRAENSKCDTTRGSPLGAKRPKTDRSTIRPSAPRSTDAGKTIVHGHDVNATSPATAAVAPIKATTVSRRATEPGTQPTVSASPASSGPPDPSASAADSEPRSCRCQRVRCATSARCLGDRGTVTSAVSEAR